MLQSYLPLLRRSTTTEAQYQQAVAWFRWSPQPPDTLLRWICRKEEYLDLTEDRLDLTPAYGGEHGLTGKTCSGLP